MRLYETCCKLWQRLHSSTQFLTMTWTIRSVNRNKLRVRGVKKKSSAALYIQFPILYLMKWSEVNRIFAQCEQNECHHWKDEQMFIFFLLFFLYKHSNWLQQCIRLIHYVFVSFVPTFFVRDVAVMTRFNFFQFNASQWHDPVWNGEKVNHTRRVSHTRTIYGIKRCTV